MDQIDVVVIGAGILGIAIARKLARQGREVLILEAESRIGQHTSSRNSGVIHAGIYYPKGSLRAKLCVAGKDMLYDYCKTRHIGHNQSGKLLVALSDEHVSRLPDLMHTAKNNGVHDLVSMAGKDAVDLEPELACKAAILSPSTGYVDVPGLLLSLLGEAEAEGAFVAVNSPVETITPVENGFQIKVGDQDQTELSCKRLINAAGLGAWNVARSIKGLDLRRIPRQAFAKGSWFSGSGKAPFEHLIYPVPDDASLGVHYTCDLGGGFKFGPDLEPLETSEINYTVDPNKQSAFENSVRRFWPNLKTGSLAPESAGVRPRIASSEFETSDFMFQGPDQHGILGLTQLFGFESPGLTASLSIAGTVASLV